MAYTDLQERSHIRELQGMLNGISYYHPAIPRIIPDGIYGKSTADAVRAFQQYYGLRQTGEVSTATWEKIAEVYQELVGTAPEPLRAFPEQKNVCLLPGDRSFTILITQSILHELAGQFAEIPDCPLTGVFDDATLRALQPFQKISGLPVTPGLDCKTWNMLAQAGSDLLVG